MLILFPKNRSSSALATAFGYQEKFPTFSDSVFSTCPPPPKASRFSANTYFIWSCPLYQESLLAIHKRQKCVHSASSATPTAIVSCNSTSRL